MHCIHALTSLSPASRATERLGGQTGLDFVYDEKLKSRKKLNRKELEYLGIVHDQYMDLMVI